MRRLLVVVVVAWPVVTAASVVTRHAVDIRDFSYDPASIRVQAGDTVVWTNQGLQRHTVTFTGQSGKERILPTDTYEETFPTAGTYRYFCELHNSMQGTVLVERSSSPTTRPSTTTTEPPEGSARTGSPDTSTTSTSTTTTMLLDGETTTTTAPADSRSGQASGPLDGDQGEGTDVDGPAAVAALLLLATGGGAFLLARTNLL